MEQQIDRPFITYESAEVQYEIEAHSKADDRNAARNIIDIVQNILDTRDKSCALDIKVTWTLD